MKVVNGHYSTLAEFNSLLGRTRQLDIDADVRARIEASYRFLESFSASKLIYGVNTGFGPMAQYRIAEEDKIQLQYNLIRGHCSGSGELIDPLLSRAVLIARFNCLVQGYSGVHSEVIDLLARLINLDIVPCIYSHGGVGASGDLVQLAHLALMLIGEGEVWHEGRQWPAAEVFARYGIEPMRIHIREGLALINGTSGMTGIGMFNLIQGRRLLYWSIVLSAMTNELVEAYDDHFSADLNAVKHHGGQQVVARAMRDLLAGSGMVRKREEHLYDPEKIRMHFFEEKVQEYYSLRCVTQILGPVLDTLRHAERVVVDEYNSVSDNPIIHAESRNVFHGGNFHGDYVALEMDKLKIAITKLAMLSERQLNYVLNEKLNGKFPPFLNLGTLGLNFGMQGVQFTAVSTVAENQTLSYPASLHSIPNNNDNQDIVSMGFNAAMLAHRVVSNTFEVLAIQMLAILQAADYLGCTGRMAGRTAAIYSDMRRIVPVFRDDRPRYAELKALATYMAGSEEALEDIDQWIPGPARDNTPGI